MQDHLPKNAYCMIALTDHFFYNLPNEKCKNNQQYKILNIIFFLKPIALFSCPLRTMNNDRKNPDDWWSN